VTARGALSWPLTRWCRTGEINGQGVISDRECGHDGEWFSGDAVVVQHVVRLDSAHLGFAESHRACDARHRAYKRIHGLLYSVYSDTLTQLFESPLRDGMTRELCLQVTADVRYWYVNCVQSGQRLR
jgi:hypothetical protein